MAVERAYGGTGLVDVLDRILDKGLVIDVWARVSLVGIELITVEARVVVASVDTYLKYAHAIGLTQLASRPPQEKSQGLLGQGGDGQNGSPLQGLTNQLQGALGQGEGGQGGGLLGGLTNQLGLGGGDGQGQQGGQPQGPGRQLQGAQGGNGQGGSPPQGPAGQLQGVIDQLHGAQGEGELPPGVADQLRSIIEQLQQGQGQAGREPAQSGRPG